jgi:predicted RNase H-like HicB family nuclease
MLKNYTANYTRISSGYMGQLIEWPEVITEGESLEDCRELLQDALHEMITAYREQQKEIPSGGALIEQIPVEIQDVCETPGPRKVLRGKRVLTIAPGQETRDLH